MDFPTSQNRLVFCPSIEYFFKLLVVSYTDLEIKVYDTEGKAIEDVTMKYKNATGVDQTSSSNTTGEISVKACHGQTLKDVTFSKACTVRTQLVSIM